MNRKRMLFRSIISIVLALSLMIPMNIVAFAGSVDKGGACTQFFMGKDTTDDGTFIWGRTEDYSASWRKILDIHPAETHAPGALFRSNERSSTFTWPYPEQTLRYIYCMDSIHNENNYPEPYGEIGMNEMNVTVSSSVTLSSSKTQITGTGGQDRMVNNGLAEIDTVALVLMQAKTAREGIELLAQIVDTKGAEGREGTVIADPNEVWFFQIFSGHQYVGVKCPDDMVGLSPNMTGNVGLDNYVDITDKDNFVVSPGLVSVAQAAGTYVGNAEGTKIKVADSYASSTSNHQSGRLRVGYGYLYGYTTNAQISANLPGSQYLNLFVKPRQDRTYSLFEAMKLLACRGQGTDWEQANPTGNSNSIGNDATQEAHVVETRPWMPDELATVEWLAMGPAEFSVYIPFYGNLVDEVYEKYNFVDQQNYNTSDPYNNTFWHVFRNLYNNCKNPLSGSTATLATREKYGSGVLAFWERYQKSFIEQQTDVDRIMNKILLRDGRAEAEKAATEISLAISQEVYEYAVTINEELKVFRASGAAGNFVPSAYLDEDAIPHYADLLSKYDIEVPTVYGNASVRRSADNNATATFGIRNDSGETVSANVILAVYDENGRLQKIYNKATTVTGNLAADSITTDTPLPPNWTAKAFIWDANFVPICIDATIF